MRRKKKEQLEDTFHHRNVFKSSGKRVGEEMDVDAIVTLHTPDFSPALTVRTGGGIWLTSCMDMNSRVRI